MRRLGRLRAPLRQGAAASEHVTLGLALAPAPRVMPAGLALEPAAQQPRDEAVKAMGVRK